MAKEKRLRGVRIEPAANGGHMVTHEYEPDDDENFGSRSAPHVFANTDAMLAHVHKLVGGHGKKAKEPPADTTRGMGFAYKQGEK